MFYHFPSIIQRLLALVYKPVHTTEYPSLDLFNLFSLTQSHRPLSSMEVYIHLSSDVWPVQLCVDLAPSTPHTTSYLEDSLSYCSAEVLIVETLKLRLTSSGLVVTECDTLAPSLVWLKCSIEQLNH